LVVIFAGLGQTKNGRLVNKGKCEGRSINKFVLSALAMFIK